MHARARIVGVILALAFSASVMMAVKAHRKHREPRRIPEVFCADPKQYAHPLWGWEAWDVSMCEYKLRRASLVGNPG